MILLIFLALLSTPLSLAQNSTYTNPILPGFHPDPSCIFVPSYNDTYFCASSSFLGFPGIPIHASRDLQKWKLASNALNRPSQLPELNKLVKATSGIWAPTIRFHEGIFYLVTTMVRDNLTKGDANRFANFVITSSDPFDSSSWTDPLFFDFEGYDASPFWDDDGQVYITGTYAWQVEPGIQLFPLNMSTGDRGNIAKIWGGTGGEAPEGPHLRKKDGYYYLNIAEGGTGADHMVTVARSRSIYGPYESNPRNPVLTNANTTAYFQDVGHADLFQDVRGMWWSVALAVRKAPDGSSPMGRETVLTPVTWEEGEWPVFTNISGRVNGWHLDSLPVIEAGEGSLIDAPAYVDFAPGTSIPPEFVHWRFPNVENFVVSPPGYPDTLQLTSSAANLTGLDGNAPQPNGTGQTFIGRRQVDSQFTFSVTFDVRQLKDEEQEVGVTAFLDQRHHYDLGIVVLPSSSNNVLTPFFRLRGNTDVPAFLSTDLALQPVNCTLSSNEIAFEIRMCNTTHYIFSAGTAGKQSTMQDIGFAPALGLTWGYTGALLGVYATTNGRDEEFKTRVSDWRYRGLQQVLD